jgi:hypothetical protein
MAVGRESKDVIHGRLSLHAQTNNLRRAQTQAGVDRHFRHHPNADRSADSLLKINPRRGRISPARGEGSGFLALCSGLAAGICHRCGILGMNCQLLQKSMTM